MTVFLDTNVLAYVHDLADTYEGCRRVIEAVAEGVLDARISTAVLEEFWHLELRSRPPGLSGATRDYYELFTPLLPITDNTFRTAVELRVRSALGANDRLHVAVSIEHGIDEIVTVDDAFAKVPGITRIDPLDRTQVDHLLARDQRESRPGHDPKDFSG